ncbi:MAG: Holliday junction resolvase RuvX [Acidobacteriota bacterium]
MPSDSRQPPTANRQPIIGIDLGGRRIGIAVSTSGVMATPHSVMRNEGDVVEKMASLGRELEAGAYVLGIPRRTHASAAEQKYVDFAEALRQKSCKPVVLWDESLSTVEAAERLRATGKRRREAQKDIDMFAAAVILQHYLDHQQSLDRSGRSS